MPEEHTYNQAPSSESKSEQNLASEALNRASHSVYPQASVDKDSSPHVNHKPEAFSSFGEENSRSIAPSMFVWLAFILTLALTGYFWLIDFGNVKSISEKENEKNEIVAQLNSENNKLAEEQAQNFSAAFSDLNTLANNSLPKSTLLADLYTHFTKDVKISIITISDEGGLAISGATGSYRQVADFMLGLKGYDKVSNLSLKNVSLNIEDGTAANQKITFSISSDIQMTKEVATTEILPDGTVAPSTVPVN